MSIIYKNAIKLTLISAITCTTACSTMEADFSKKNTPKNNITRRAPLNNPSAQYNKYETTSKKESSVFLDIYDNYVGSSNKNIYSSNKINFKKRPIANLNHLKNKPINTVEKDVNKNNNEIENSKVIAKKVNNSFDKKTLEPSKIDSINNKKSPPPLTHNNDQKNENIESSDKVKTYSTKIDKRNNKHFTNSPEKEKNNKLDSLSNKIEEKNNKKIEQNSSINVLSNQNKNVAIKDSVLTINNKVQNSSQQKIILDNSEKEQGINHKNIKSDNESNSNLPVTKQNDMNSSNNIIDKITANKSDNDSENKITPQISTMPSPPTNIKNNKNISIQSLVSYLKTLTNKIKFIIA